MSFDQSSNLVVWPFNRKDHLTELVTRPKMSFAREGIFAKNAVLQRGPFDIKVWHLAERSYRPKISSDQTGYMAENVV